MTVDFASAVLSLTSTVVGAAIGLGASYVMFRLTSSHQDQRDAASRAHEASVRFHDERMVSYGEFSSAALFIAATAKVWASTGGAGHFTASEAAGSALDAYVRAVGRTRLLAKAALRDKLAEVHRHVQRLTTELISGDPVIAIADELTRAVGQFEIAAREELEIR